MATKKYVSDTKLKYFWDKIKNYINNIVKKSDWEETDITNNAYILNKPAIKAGEGENGVVIGQTEQNEDYVTYTLTINGEASATTFTYTTEDDLSQFSSSFSYAYYEAGNSNLHKYAKVVLIDKINSTIELTNSFSTSAIVNGTLVIYSYDKNKALGDHSLAEGKYALSIGGGSHAEGSNTFAYQLASHAEGLSTVAQGVCSHAEGSKTNAKGPYSHAEGYNTQASFAAHSEGQETIASGSCSHAEGFYTTAQRKSQHVFGEYNILDVEGSTGSRGNYIEIVGNGASESTRSNARTLDWFGNEVLAGKLTVGTEPTEDMDVTTKQYVDNVSVTAQNIANALGYTPASDALVSNSKPGLISAEDYQFLTGDVPKGLVSKVGGRNGWFLQYDDVTPSTESAPWSWRELNTDNISDFDESVNTMVDEAVATPTFVATDATSKSVIKNAFGVDAQIVTPESITSVARLIALLSPKTWFVWLNGAEVEFARLAVGLNASSNQVHMILHGMSSFASGTMGSGDWAVVPDDTDDYKIKVDTLWDDYQSAITALG
jgi:hypothetical protein